MASNRTDKVTRIIRNVVKNNELGVKREFLARLDGVLDKIVTPEAEASFAEFESRYFGNHKVTGTKKPRATTRVTVAQKLSA